MKVSRKRKELGWNYERSELQAEWDEVFDDRQVLGDGAEGGRVQSVGEAPTGQPKPKSSRERRTAKKGS